MYRLAAQEHQAVPQNLGVQWAVRPGEVPLGCSHKGEIAWPCVSQNGSPPLSNVTVQAFENIYMHAYRGESLGYNILSVNTGYFKRQSFKMFFSLGSSDWSINCSPPSWSTDLVTFLLECPQVPQSLQLL